VPKNTIVSGAVSPARFDQKWNGMRLGPYTKVAMCLLGTIEAALGMGILYTSAMV